ncbi:hypothetical protein CL616_01345 [archaeon]|nr:hypothetical protein [archaeon]|tara:strand:+ start:328 stop:537 length:210 start_codon:yes stop_codon:yes gene_type:complete
MPRRNPYLFKPEEYQFLHRVFLNTSESTKTFASIKKKGGLNLDKQEIIHVKKRFVEWKEADNNELLWMN